MTEFDENVRIAYWLLPEEQVREKLWSVICQLAASFQAPVFLPHLTFFSGPAPLAHAPEELLEDATQGLGPISLNVASVEFGETFTQSLFLRLTPGPSLVELSQRVQTRLNIPASNLIMPHVSLLYGQIPNSQKQLILKDLDLSLETIVFDEVQAVLTRKHTESRRDVERWRTLCRLRLT